MLSISAGLLRIGKRNCICRATSPRGWHNKFSIQYFTANLSEALASFFLACQMFGRRRTRRHQSEAVAGGIPRIIVPAGNQKWLAQKKRMFESLVVFG